MWSAGAIVRKHHSLGVRQQTFISINVGQSQIPRATGVWEGCSQVTNRSLGSLQGRDEQSSPWPFCKTQITFLKWSLWNLITSQDLILNAVWHKRVWVLHVDGGGGMVSVFDTPYGNRDFRRWWCVCHKRVWVLHVDWGGGMVSVLDTPYGNRDFRGWWCPLLSLMPRAISLPLFCSNPILCKYLLHSKRLAFFLDHTNKLIIHFEITEDVTC